MKPSDTSIVNPEFQNKNLKTNIAPCFFGRVERSYLNHASHLKLRSSWTCLSQPRFLVWTCVWVFAPLLCISFCREFSLFLRWNFFILLWVFFTLLWVFLILYWVLFIFALKFLYFSWVFFILLWVSLILMSVFLFYCKFSLFYSEFSLFFCEFSFFYCNFSFSFSCLCLCCHDFFFFFFCRDSYGLSYIRLIEFLFQKSQH